MGAGNVGLVYARWGHLSHAPFRVLAYMALRTLDDDDPPQFWGGRESLAVALGRIVPKPQDEQSRRERKAAFEAVKEMTTVLKKAGAVELVEAARPGRNAVYALNLHRRMVGLEPPPSQNESPRFDTEGMVGSEHPPVVGVQTPPVVGAEPADGGRSAPTRGEEEELTTNEGGGRADLRDARHHSAHAREDDEKISSPPPPRTPGPACGGCGTELDPDGTCFMCGPRRQ